MLSPKAILPVLLGGAIGAAGILQSLHWKAVRAPAAPADLESRVRALGGENEALRRENETLRALARSGGEVAVPPELVQLVETSFGLRFLTPPAVHRTSAAKLRDRIAASIESGFGPSGVDDRQQCYTLIGWLRPDDDLLTLLTAVRCAGASAWFDEGSGEAWMPDQTNLNHIPDQAALVHLLARMLFHQHFPPAADYPGDDAARAREALHHGVAAGAEARFNAEKVRTDGFMAMKENKEFKQVFAILPPFLQGVTRFPGVEGKGFADVLFMRGNDALHAACRNPPPTTHAIFSPGAPPASLAALELPATPEEPLLTESAGRLGLLLWLQPLGDAAAVEIAATWKNDRYALFPDGESSSAILWDIELGDAASADRLEACARKLADSIGERKSPEVRHLRVVRVSPTRVRFLNTTQAATSVEVGGG